MPDKMKRNSLLEFVALLLEFFRHRASVQIGVRLPWYGKGGPATPCYDGHSLAVGTPGQARPVSCPVVIFTADGVQVQLPADYVPGHLG